MLVHGDYKVGNFVWRGNAIATVLDWEAPASAIRSRTGLRLPPLMRSREPELMAMLVPFDELVRLYESETGEEVDRQRLHYYLIYALYFHLYTFMSGLVAAARRGLGVARLREVPARHARAPAPYRRLGRGYHVL